MNVNGLKERVGFLYSGSQDSLRGQLVAFHRGLKEAGYVDGQNVEVQYRAADNNYDKLADLAADLVDAAVDVIVAAGGQIAAVKAKEATDKAKRPTPIIFTTVANPFALGLVNSPHKPGGNVTGTAGLTSELDPARLELLDQVMRAQTDKRFSRDGLFGVLRNKKRPRVDKQSDDLEKAAKALGRDLLFLDADPGQSLEKAFHSFASFGKQIKSGDASGVIVTADPFFNSQRALVVKLVSDLFKLPAIYQWREFVSAGGLMSYGPSLVEAYHQAGVYVGRILDGESPGDLPVQRPTKFELVINLKTADSLKLQLPPEVIGRPDVELIE